MEGEQQSSKGSGAEGRVSEKAREAGEGLVKSLLQHHSSKASILRRSAFFTVQLSHPYMTTGKTIVLARRTFVGISTDFGAPKNKV